MAECASLLYVGRLQPSNSITSICSDLSYVHVVPVHSCAAVGKNSTTSRGPSAIAELLVIFRERRFYGLKSYFDVFSSNVYIRAAVAQGDDTSRVHGVLTHLL